MVVMMVAVRDSVHRPRVMMAQMGVEVMNARVVLPVPAVPGRVEQNDAGRVAARP